MLVTTDLNKKNDSILFEKKALRVQLSFNETFFNRDTGLYRDGENVDHYSLHSNMFPLVFGLILKKNKERVISFIKDKRMACSVYGAQYLLEGLFDNFEEEFALELLTNTSERGWWNMIRNGSTMTTEAWDNKFKSNLDWNHAWGTAPLNLISRKLWGINPIKPGFKEVLIKPLLFSLNNSEISIPTKYGTIKGFYEKNENVIKLNIEIPNDIVAYINLPGLYSEGYLNGVLRANFNKVKLKKGENLISINYE